MALGLGLGLSDFDVGIVKTSPATGIVREDQAFSWPLPSFYAPLTKSLLPYTTQGSGIPTFSRATAAYVQDHESVWRQVLSNEARFWGARRVRNLLPRSEVLNAGSWSVVGPVSITGANQATFTGSVATLQNSVGYTFGVGTVFVCRVRLSGIAGETVNLYLDTSGGVYEQSAATVITLTSTPTDYDIVFVCAQAAHTAIWLNFQRTAIRTVTVMNVHRVQMEDVTGQSVQTPSEYVSTNVLSAPYQGANVDGVQYFDTVRLHTQNMIRQSETLTGGGWASGTGTSITAAGTSYDGVYQANKVLSDGANTQHIWLGNLNVTIPAYTVWTYAVDVKQADSDWVEFAVANDGFTQYSGSKFRFSTQTFQNTSSSVAVPTLSYVALSNGWYRLTMTNYFTVDSSTAHPYLTLLDNSGNATFTVPGAGTGTLFARPQMRLAAPSLLSTYVPTTTAAVGPTDTGTTAPIPSTTLLGYLSEQASTNGSPNNQATGATVGVIGSGGVLPTNWSQANNTPGLTVTVVGTGFEDGIPYVDVRWNGTPSASAGIGIYAAPNSGANKVTAASGQTWTGSWFLKLVAGSLTNLGTPSINVDEWSAAPAYLAGTGSAAVLTSTRLGQQRYWRTSTLGNASTVTVNCAWAAQTTLNQAVDVTIRFGLPQLEQAAVVTTPVPTTSGALTRNQDTLLYQVTSNVNNLVGSAYCEFRTNQSVPGNSALVTFSSLTQPGAAMYVGGAFSLQMYDNTNFPTAGGGALSLANVDYKAASNWDASGTLRLTATGRTVGTSVCVATGIFAVNSSTIGIGTYGGAAGQPNAPIRNVRIYNQKLTDTQLAAMVA